MGFQQEDLGFWGEGVGSQYGVCGSVVECLASAARVVEKLCNRCCVGCHSSTKLHAWHIRTWNFGAKDKSLTFNPAGFESQADGVWFAVYIIFGWLSKLWSLFWVP